MKKFSDLRVGDIIYCIDESGGIRENAATDLQSKSMSDGVRWIYTEDRDLSCNGCVSRRTGSRSIVWATPDKKKAITLAIEIIHKKQDFYTKMERKTVKMLQDVQACSRV